MLGRNARTVSKHIDRLRASGNLGKGFCWSTEGAARGVGNEGASLLPRSWKAVRGQPDPPGRPCRRGRGKRTFPVVVVTKDTNLRLKADALGDHRGGLRERPVDIEKLYRGFREVNVGKGSSTPSRGGGVPSASDAGPASERVPHLPRRRIPVVGSGTGRRAVRKIRLLSPSKDDVWGVRHRRTRADLRHRLLLDDSVKLVTLAGKAGTGKTLLAIAADYGKPRTRGVPAMLVSRARSSRWGRTWVPPGDVEEKLKPWMQADLRQREYLFGFSRKERQGGVRGYQELINLGILEIETLTYIRGRSIPNQFIIVDEAQNLSPHEVKTILTRARGEQQGGPDGRPYQNRQPLRRLGENGLSARWRSSRGGDPGPFFSSRRAFPACGARRTSCDALSAREALMRVLGIESSLRRDAPPSYDGSAGCFPTSFRPGAVTARTGVDRNSPPANI